MPRLLPLLLLCAFLLLSVRPVHAQLTVSMEAEARRDSLFEARISQAWAEIRAFEGRGGAVAAEDDPRRSLAPELFSYYLDHPATPTGERALDNAFVMWGDVGAADAVEEAVAHLDRAADLWAAILTPVSQAYLNAGRKDEYVRLLRELETTLTHPRGLSSVLLKLGIHYAERGDTTAAAARFNRIIALDAHPFYVRQAEGSLYDMNVLAVGKPAPDFTAATITGETVTLSELKGKVVLLDFWATWCGPCYPEFPRLRQLAEDYAEQGFILIGIALDTDRAFMEQTVKEQNLDWPHILESQAWEGLIPTRYGVSTLPQTFLIDREGRIAHKNLRGEALAQAVQQTLGTAP